MKHMKGEKEFPLGNSFFPTSNIRELIGNPDYPDDEATECTKPFLNKRWIDVPAIQWYPNAEFVNFASNCALSYFFLLLSGIPIWRKCQEEIII
jgi:hypothetical protein